MQTQKVGLEELKPGKTLMVGDGFTCMNPGKYRVKIDKKGLYIRCIKGKHYLDGQVGSDGKLIGMELLV